jgi:hypothetical protein
MEKEERATERNVASEMMSGVVPMLQKNTC